MKPLRQFLYLDEYQDVFAVLSDVRGIHRVYRQLPMRPRSAKRSLKKGPSEVVEFSLIW